MCVSCVVCRVSGMRVSGMRVSGMRVSGMRVSGMRVSGMRGVVCVVSCVGQSVSNQGVSIRLRVYGYACACV